MDKEFSKGFRNDIADLLELCIENEADNVDLSYDINGVTLNINIVFSITREGGGSDE